MTPRVAVSIDYQNVHLSARSTFLPFGHSWPAWTCLDAVTAGLTLPHSSGPVEGHVNKHGLD
ncbi:hypothetical protein UG55_103616 [Frankia sp. EI5c]|uniref:hypothetical protein n=1 Tax=Frankia sp. EI5c TaxID=683316 RepID=UPI0007C29ED5|nr:hypothetical protein [Frankia sp. EI5c]OAA23491.1 hypothetical protein UG55_103616 [Frankia sp. EI5c]